MNRWYQNGLFANRQLSFSGRNLGKSVCYAIVLVAVSTISWVPEGGCQAPSTGIVCPRFYPHNPVRNSRIPEEQGYSGCVSRNNGNRCAAECACYAIDIRNSQARRSPWVISSWGTYCKQQGFDARALEEAYRNHMNW
jgi:hypothetical protein